MSSYGDFTAGGDKHGMDGINIDEQMGNNSFDYLIADNYNPALVIPEGFIVRTISAFTWAVFLVERLE